MGKKLSPKQIELLKNMYQESWAIDFAKQKIVAYINDATTTLRKITFANQQSKQYINQLITNLMIS
jgi:hypothetical protein